jgi:short-subunit dehydrogenase
MDSRATALIFGSSGSIGSACKDLLFADYEIFAGPQNPNEIPGAPVFDTVIWAQGINRTLSFIETSEEDWECVLEANFHLVRKSIQILLRRNQFASPSSLVFVGSVWSNLSRRDKSAYIVSKSALEGLCRALAVELAPLKIRVNCVLPGVVENQMTKSNLTDQQMKNVKSQTPGGDLVSPIDVANTIKFLSSSSSQGITGQSIIVDNGWSIARFF